MPEESKKRGPKEDRLVIDKPWEEAIEEALRKKRSSKGWSKPEKPEKEQPTE